MDYTRLRPGDHHGSDIIRDKNGWHIRVDCTGLIQAAARGAEEYLYCTDCDAVWSLDGKDFGPYGQPNNLIRDADKEWE